MRTSNSKTMLEALDAIRAQIADLAGRVGALEGKSAPPAPPPFEAKPPEPPLERAAAGKISEEHLMALSAAVGAFLGIRAHIRSITVISSPAWAQQGRVSVQASHRLH